MIVKNLILGPLSTNVYLLIKDNDCLLVDPATDFDVIKNEIGTLNLVGILITHYHFDHIGALEQLKKDYNVPIYDYRSKDIPVENFNFEIIHTPGHTNDSVSFYFKKEKIMFVGDFIFRKNIGRTDFETGNMRKMLNSLQRIKKYNDDIILYPGHGKSTTLGYEKLNNAYLKG